MAVGLLLRKRWPPGRGLFISSNDVYVPIVFPNVFIYPTLCYNNFSLLQMKLYYTMSGLKWQ